MGSASSIMFLILLIFLDDASSEFTPSITTSNSTLEFSVPLNADIHISYFDDAGVFISTTRVITQQILDDAVATLKNTCGRIQSAGKQLCSAGNIVFEC